MAARGQARGEGRARRESPAVRSSRVGMSLTLSDAIHLLGNLLGEVLAAQESPALLEAEERIRALAKARRAGDTAAAATLARDVEALPPATARADRLRLHALLRPRQPGRGGPSDPGAPAAGPGAGAGADQRVHRRDGRRAPAERRLPRPDGRAAAGPQRRARAHGASDRGEAPQRAVEAPADQRRPVGPPPGRSRAARAGRRRDVALRAEITALWLTDRARTARPEVTDEVRTGLYFVEHTFWEVLPRVHAELAAAVAEHYPGLTVPRRWLGLGSWIGGDRDGNPYVTAAVTAETLRLAPGPRRRAAPSRASGSRAAASA